MNLSLLSAELNKDGKNTLRRENSLRLTVTRISLITFTAKALSYCDSILGMAIDSFLTSTGPRSVFQDDRPSSEWGPNVISPR